MSEREGISLRENISSGIDIKSDDDGKLCVHIDDYHKLKTYSTSVGRIVRDVQYDCYYVYMKKHWAWRKLWPSGIDFILEDNDTPLLISMSEMKMMSMQELSEDENFVVVTRTLDGDKIIADVVSHCPTTNAFKLNECGASHRYVVTARINEIMNLSYLFDIKTWNVIDTPNQPVDGNGNICDIKQLISAKSDNVNTFLRSIMNENDILIEQYKAICCNIFIDKINVAGIGSGRLTFHDASPNNVLSRWVEMAPRYLNHFTKVVSEVEYIRDDTRCFVDWKKSSKLEQLKESGQLDKKIIIIRPGGCDAKRYEYVGNFSRILLTRVIQSYSLIHRMKSNTCSEI
jgi:hypothetical protein